MKTAQYPRAANSRQTIAEPNPTVIHTRPKPNPAALPRYRNEPPIVYLLVVNPCPTTIRGGTAETFKSSALPTSLSSKKWLRI